MLDRSPYIVIRTDASLKIGSGHVMRCLTLAEKLRESGADVSFVSRTHPGNLIDLIHQKEFVINELAVIETQSCNIIKEKENESEYHSWLGTSQDQDANDTISTFQEKRVDWLIVDHYGLGQVWEQQLRPHVGKIMVIDDMANRLHDCDLLLDQNYFHDVESRYEELVSPCCTKLLGPRYALLRPEFAEERKHLKPRTGKVRSVFVFLGGTDPENETGKILGALSDSELAHLEVVVVLGKTNPNLASIQKQVALRPNTNLAVQSDNIAELMVRADIAFGGGGATTWERLCLGLPSIVVVLSENQKKVSEALHEAGLQICLGNAKELSVIDLKTALLKQLKKVKINCRLSEKCLEIVDGKGSEIIKEMILKGIPVEQWRIRSASSADCEFYWHLVNDVDVRQSAFDSEPISLEDHQEWFKKKLNDPSTTLFLVESQFGPIGQVRFEKSGDHFMIDYSIGRQFRGLGLGEQLLTKGIESFKNTQGFTLVGEVKEENQASAKVFKRLGFKEVYPPPKKHTRYFQFQFSQNDILG